MLYLRLIILYVRGFAAMVDERLKTLRPAEQAATRYVTSPSRW